MSEITVKLLRAASARLGGESALAGYFGISEALLDQFMRDHRTLPLALLLRAVDLITEDRGYPVARPLEPKAPSIQGLGNDR